MDHDIGIIRPQLRLEDIKFRGEGISPQNLRKIKKALRSFHTLETMAANIYKFQITPKKTEIDRQLNAAMCNEMTHLQDFQVKLYEYRLVPSKLRWIYWMVGIVLGFSSRLLGRTAILKTGIWVEAKAVHHYAELLQAADWDDDSRLTIEKDQADEHGHIARWTALLIQE